MHTPRKENGLELYFDELNVRNQHLKKVNLSVLMDCDVIIVSPAKHGRNIGIMTPSAVWASSAQIWRLSTKF